MPLTTVDPYARPTFVTTGAVPRPADRPPEFDLRAPVADIDQEHLPRFLVTVRIVVDAWDSVDTLWRDCYRLSLLGPDRVGFAPGQCISEHEVHAWCPSLAIAQVLDQVDRWTQEGFDMASAEPLDYAGPTVMWVAGDDGSGFWPEHCIPMDRFDDWLQHQRDLEAAAELP